MTSQRNRGHGFFGHGFFVPGRSLRSAGVTAQTRARRSPSTRAAGSDASEAATPEAPVLFNRRLTNIQGLRALAALSIVLLHAGQPDGFEHRYLHVTHAIFLKLAVTGYWGVDLFFIISGFIMAITTFGRPQLPSSGSFFLARVIRIYPMYWIMTSIVLFLYVVRPELVPKFNAAHPPNIIASYFALPQSGEALVMVGWSLVFEMYFYTIFAAALWGGGRWTKPLLLTWSAALVVGGIVFFESTDPWLGVVVNPLCIEFLMGIGVALLIMARKVRAPLALVALGCVGYAIEFSFGYPHDLYVNGWTHVFEAIPLAALVAGLVELELRGTFVFPRFMVHLGDASYSLYLSHILVLAFIGNIIVRTHLLGAAASSILVTALVIVVLHLVAVGLYRWVEQPIGKNLHRLARYRRAHALAVSTGDA